MCMGVLPACLCITCVPGALGGQNRTLDPLKHAYRSLSVGYLPASKSAARARNHRTISKANHPSYF